MNAGPTPLDISETQVKVVLVDPGWLRRLIKWDRSLSSLVPHAHCYTIRRAALRRALGALPTGQTPGAHSGFGTGPDDQPLILVARPSARELRRQDRAEHSPQVARATLHARVHLEFEALIERGVLDANAIRKRIAVLGRVEFETIRATLEQDDLLLPPGSDREVYVEFAALFLELCFFAPELLPVTFPGIEDVDAVCELLERDLDLVSLSQGPEVRAHGKPIGQAPLSRSSLSIPPRPAEAAAKPPSRARVRRWLKAADRDFKRGQHLKSALLATRALLTDDVELSRHAQQLESAAIGALRERLERLLAEPSSDRDASTIPLSIVLTTLVRATRHPTPFRASAELRILRLLERAMRSVEEPGYLIDVPGWLLSFGRRPAARPQGDTALLRAARFIAHAVETSSTLSLPRSERARIGSVLLTARDRAEENVRATLRPKIQDTLSSVGLTPVSGPEAQGRDNLVEELLDQILLRGFSTLSQWRDAVSSNSFGLRDLGGIDELWRGDALLRADARLSVVLDGVHHRGDLYLRVLQTLSSLPFGTRLGRGLTLYVLLPLLGSFTVLEGTRLIVGPVRELFGAPPLAPFEPIVFLPPALLLLLLLHSETSRLFGRMAFDAMGWVLGTIFVRLPRALLSSLFVRAILSRRSVRVFLRCGVIPAGLAALGYWSSSLGTGSERTRLLIACAIGLSGFALMSSSLGWRLELLIVDELAPTWRTFSRHWIPALFRSISRGFSFLLDGLERIMHWVGDGLGFRTSQSAWTVLLAGSAGLVWAVIAYVTRLYVTLLVEPEVNPIKHFPVVTVAHKLTLPFAPDLLAALEKPFFSVFGPIAGGALVGLTVFLFPSVFGFLAWELKSNYRLYRKTRSPYVQSVRFGPSGETLRELLVPGLHSGTLPKLYQRRRHTVQRLVEQTLRAQDGGHGTRSLSRVSLEGTARFGQRLDAIRRSIARFVERELFPPLERSERWKPGPLRLSEVRVGPHRIRVLFAPRGLPSDASAEIVFEQVGGHVIASLSRDGFLHGLDATTSRLFENALAVFYHRAGVDLVREQLTFELGWDVAYEITSAGLVYWPSAGYETELVYPLGTYWRKSLRPKIRGPKPSTAPPALAAERILYPKQKIRWRDWEAAWARGDAPDAPLPRLLEAGSLLPGVAAPRPA